MHAIIRPVTALLMSAAIVLAANGLEGVLLPLRAAIEGFSPIEIGLIGSAYFGGMTIGCFIGPRVIARVGHIRAFGVFAALATLSPLIEAMWVVPPFWWLMRCVTGICFAGIMNVVESWLTGVASNDNRGQVLSVYAIINFGSLTLGQQLSNLAPPQDFRLFSLIAMLCVLSIVPLALTLSPSPPVPRRPRLRLRQLYAVSPAAVAGCVGAGLANGAIWAIAPVYAREIGLPDHLIAAFISFIVLGGALSQWPVGRISDRVDRRLVLAAVCAGAAVIGLVLFFVGDLPPVARLALGACFGACALPVYWISFAHANDLAEPEEAVNISSNLLLLFGLGAIVGPTAASLLKEQMGTGSLFLYTASIHVLVTGAVLYRRTQRLATPPEDRVSYEDIPTTNTPAGFEPGIPAAAETGRP